MIIEQHTDMAGKIRITWQSQATGNIYLYKFTSEPTEQKLQSLSDASDQETQLTNIRPLEFRLESHREILVMFVHRIKDFPNVTLAQYNNFLSNLPWYEAAVIRYFVFVMAERLAERKDVSISDKTETTVLRAVRDFIVDKPLRELARLILNETNL